MLPSRTASPDAGGVLVVGAGPGVGLAVARRFSDHGRAVGLIARDEDRLRRLAITLQDEGRRPAWAVADVTDVGRLRTAIQEVRDRTGPIATLCYSPLPPAGTIRPVAETDAEDLMAALALTVGGAAAAVRAVLPDMVRRGTGQLLFTTGSGGIRPSADRASSAVYTAAESAYVQVLRDGVEGLGIRVVQLVVVGPVGGSGHRPDAVADALRRLADDGGGYGVLEL